MFCVTVIICSVHYIVFTVYTAYFTIVRIVRSTLYKDGLPEDKARYIRLILLINIKKIKLTTAVSYS